jgi:hypothetical protein
MFLLCADADHGSAVAGPGLVPNLPFECTLESQTPALLSFVF